MNVWLERAYRFRGVLMAPPYLFCLLVFAGETEHDAVIWRIGLTVFFIGVAIRVWAQVHLHYRLRIHKTLTTTGPYSLVRNPIYIANTTMLLGLTVVSELIWFLPLMLAWCVLVYRFVVRREEAHLTEKYGAPYVSYLQTTSRWVPRFGSRGLRPEMARRFLLPSLVAEAHCLLLVIPLVAKEFFG